MHGKLPTLMKRDQSFPADSLGPSESRTRGVEGGRWKVEGGRWKVEEGSTNSCKGIALGYVCPMYNAGQTHIT